MLTRQARFERSHSRIFEPVVMIEMGKLTYDWLTQERIMSELTGSAIPEVALAILHPPSDRPDRFLMQLRDNLPTILYPDRWGLFGGSIEAGETPLEGMKRELQEEIAYVPEDISLFQSNLTSTVRGQVRRHFFRGTLAVDLNRLILGEGTDLALVSLSELQEGSCYSPRLGAMRPLGTPHRQAILNFVKTLPVNSSFV